MPRSDRRLLDDCVAALYGALAEGPDALREPLHRFARGLGATGVHWIDLSHGAPRSLVLAGMDTARMGAYYGHYAGEDPWVAATLASGAVNHAVLTQRLIDERAFRAGAFFNEFLRREDEAYFAMGALLTEPEGRPLGSIGLVASRQSGGFDARRAALLDALLPHLAQVLRLGALLPRAAFRDLAASAALAQAAVPLLLLTPEGVALETNEAAQAALSCGGPLSLVGGRLSACPAEQQQLLLRALRSAAWPGAAPAPLVLGANGGRWTLTLSPLRLGNGSPLLLARLAGPPALPSAQRLGADFGLTPAEARLARALVEGASPAAFAARRGLSRNTVRNQLAAVFLKTGTHRQADLVRLLLTRA